MKTRINYYITILLLFSSVLNAQVTFIISDIPDATPLDDTIYITGSFNGWDSGDTENALTINNQENWEITLVTQLEGSTIQYKFTRGDMGTVERGVNGEVIVNREFTFGNGDTVYIDIMNWADFDGESTAADNVYIIDDDFYMPQLDRMRRIWIYLPQNYSNNPDEYYPVIYMHDGQYMFDSFASGDTEMEVDETLNELENLGVNVPIVVAIDNGGLAHRVDEYTPWMRPSGVGGEGLLYIDFIIETLKPFIDENYRTLPDRIHTGILGASLGGLISHYGALAHQDVFSKAGIFSPSYWWSDTVWTFVQETGNQEAMKLYQMTGGLETDTMISSTLLMHDSLLSVGFSEDEVFSIIIPGGEHNDALWAPEFEEAYLWLFTDYISTGIETLRTNNSINIYPNPAYNTIHISNIPNFNEVSLKVLDITGKVILKLNDYRGDAINIGALSPGSYILHIHSESGNYYGKFIKNH
jgi:predicted alpha/beta superfamily hydrolase